MIAPFSTLTIGDMYTESPGYISSLTFTVQDNGTWEVDFAKLPKYVQVACNFIYIGDRLPSAEQKHFDCDWIPQINYGAEITRQNVPTIDQVLGNKYNPAQAITNAGTDSVKKFLKSVGL